MKKAKILSRAAIREFVDAEGYQEVNKEVRTNTNGYPFVTFINAENEAENIYFSKEQAKLVHEGQNSLEAIRGKNILEIEYENGDIRLKISGAGERLSLGDL
jgi:hypothetical protein